MGLSNEIWTPISIHTVVAEFLQGEREKVAGTLTPEWARIVDQPDISCPLDNHLRLRLLYRIRLLLLVEVPPDTAWFQVRHMKEDDLSALRVIGRCGWDDPRDGNELGKTALRLPREQLRTPASHWHSPILWGHDKSGPFTILDGNHRLMALVANESVEPLSIEVIVGLSPMPCFWHLPGPHHMLVSRFVNHVNVARPS
jgi:hypothetical protein